MKPEIIIQQGLKSANILLKNAQKRAAELDHLKGELVIIHQLVDIEPVALGGGDAPSGGVGLLQVALVLQIGHVVADGGGGHIQPRPLGHRLGAYRLGVLDIELNDGPEDLLFSLAQLQTAHLLYGFSTRFY